MKYESRLTEEEIRPRDLNKKQKELFLEDIKKLASKKDYFIKVPCPACSCDNYNFVLSKYSFIYVRCSHCSTVFMNPRPTPGVLETYYGGSLNYDFWNSYVFPASEAARREKIFKPRVLRIIELCKESGFDRPNLLEVGAGFGTFCEEAAKTGFFKEITAVEPTPQLAETCRKRGINVIESPVEKVDFNLMDIDIIVSFEVIEHLFEPVSFLSKCNEILKKGSLIVLSCPSFNGFDITVMGEISDTIDPEHLNYFIPDSFRVLLERTGFEAVEISTPGKLDADLVRTKVTEGQFDISNQPFLQMILFDKWNDLGNEFQNFLAKNGLSSHMWVTAKKV